MNGIKYICARDCVKAIYEYFPSSLDKEYRVCVAY